MTLFQTKKLSILIALTFLCIVLLSSHIHVLAETIDKSDMAQTLWEEGREAFNAEDYEIASKKFNDSINFYKEIGDRRSEADLLTWMAAIIVELEAGNSVDAMNYLKKSKEIYSKLKSKPGEKAFFKNIDRAIKALMLFVEGLNHENAKNYNSAMKKYKEVLQLVKEMGKKRYEAGTLLKIGISQYELKNYSGAEHYYQNALVICRELSRKRDEGRLLVFIAAVYFAKDEKVKSLSYINEALRVLEQIDDKKVKAYALSWAGRIYIGLLEYSTALYYYKKALKLYKEIGDHKRGVGYFNISLKYYKQALNIVQGVGNRPEEGSILHIVGQMYSNMGDYTEALKAYNKAMQIFKELNELINLENVLVDIGRVQSDLGNYLEAIDNLQKALDIFGELKESYGQENALEALRDVYMLLGDYKKAKEYNLKVQNIDRTDKKTKLGQWLSLFRQGQALEKEKKFDKALSIYFQALDLSKEINKEKGKAMSLTSIGYIYFQLKEYQKALDFYRQALKVSSEQKSKIEELVALRGIANTYYRLLDFQNAIDYYRQALIISKEIGSKPSEIMCFTGMGFAYLDQKKYEKAAEYFERDLIASKEIRAPKEIWQSQYWLGIVAAKSGQLQKAKHHYADAITTIESIREKISVGKYKTSFIEDKLSVYQDMIIVLLYLKENDEAFNYVERAKSRSFLDLLGNRAKLKKGKDKELSEEKRRLQKKINDLLERIQKEHSWQKNQRAVLTIWNKELDKARKEYADLLLKIKRENPELSSLVSVNPLTLREVQNLLEPDTTLLEYFIFLDGIVIWVVDRAKHKSVVKLIPYTKLVAKITALREKIETLQPDYEKEAKELYDLLIRPAKPYIKTKRIAIVPHSVLHYLPFQALVDRDNKNRFLIEEYDIFYTPSASVLRFVYEKRKEISGKVLAFGNPELGDEKLNLPYAEEEVKKIKESYPKTALYLKENATEEKAKKLSGDYNIIHFASHGELNPVSPLFSSIQLAEGSDEDGRLEVHEIFNLNLENASLVTLSACETGLGKLSSGDELIGLTRGFIYAGTPSIVASLWRVNDQSTSELMGLFYKNLKTHSKAEALRMAQIEMIRGEIGKGIIRGVGGITTSKEGNIKPAAPMTVDGSHPYFWAPFILLGDWK